MTWLFKWDDGFCIYLSEINFFLWALSSQVIYVCLSGILRMEKYTYSFCGLGQLLTNCSGHLLTLPEFFS